MTTLELSAIGSPLHRLDGRAKVTGTAPYAFEHPVDEPLYLYPLQAVIARGRVADMDTAAAEATDRVAAVLTHQNAGRLAATKALMAVLFNAA
jgi:xanthine dehydrogenase YagR molybdenum-binding subunit